MQTTLRITVCLAALAGAYVTAAVSELQVGTKTVSVDDPRPLAQAIFDFEHAYGVAVTYEDPRFSHPFDLVARQSPNGGLRDLIPRGGPFSATFEAPAPQAGEAEVATTVNAIVTAYNASAYPGRFRVVRASGMVHVVPSLVLGAGGTAQNVSSILDTPISIPAENGRSLLNGLRASLAAVSAATGYVIEIGTAPNNLVRQSRMEAAASNVKAGEVIAQALRLSGRDVSWRLLYGASEKSYMFNLYIVNRDVVRLDGTNVVADQVRHRRLRQLLMALTAS